MDNPFFNFMGRIADLILLNIVCAICCIPIITIGPALTALYYVTLKMVRNEESYIVKGFFKSFKENFKQSAIINLFMLIAGIFLYFDLRIVGQMEGSFYRVLFCIFIMFTVIYLMVLLYIYPISAKFYNTIKNTFVNSLLMAIRHLPYTAIMLVIAFLPVAIFFIPFAQIMSICLLIFVLMGLSLVAYGQSYFFVKIFDNYIPEEPAASLEDSVVSGDSTL